MRVTDKISPKDPMFKPAKPERYELAGKQAISIIESALSIGNKDVRNIKKILDFPSGYGRVLRYLKAVFKNSKIYACDIDPDMLNFCKNTLGAIPLNSKENFDEISFQHKFDLIWCGSLFTHIDEDDWKSLLRLFLAHLVNGGILVFTVHGRQRIYDVNKGLKTFGFKDSQISKIKKDCEKRGFGFLMRGKERKSGISLSSPSFVIKTIEKIPAMKLLMYNETGWLRQDVVAIQKDPKLGSI